MIRHTATAVLVAFSFVSFWGRDLPAEPLRFAPRPPWTTSRVQGSPDNFSYRIVDAYPKLKFNKPVSVAEVPGSGWVYVAELAGVVRAFALDRTSDRPETVLDLSPSGGNLLDFTFHPKFASNRFVYICTVNSNRKPGTAVSRFVVDSDNPPSIRAASEAVLFEWPAGGHNGSCLRFGPDGMLYISAGDGVGPNPPDVDGLAQDISAVPGSILRIDVDHQSGGRRYAIPPDNPFREHPGALPEIWAYGFRNPWRMGFDFKTGDLWVCDVGWETWEMVHLVRRGQNHGWSVMEGRMPQRADATPGPTPIVPPVKDHPRSEANSITGGVVYAGNRHADLHGTFVYGDYVTGKIWGIRPDGGTHSVEELVDTPLRIIAFAENSRGEIYVLDHDFTEKLYVLRKKSAAVNAAAFPAKLSETGLFSSVDKLESAPGLVPYSIVAEPWIDGAGAERFIALPGDSKVTPSDSSGRGEAHHPWKFPDGTVFVRTLFLGERRVETQILHYEEESWRPYTYAWNDAQEDADLVEAVGVTKSIPVAATGSDEKSTERTWRFAGRSECVLCHNPAVGGVLGFEYAQLDRPVEPGGEKKNQVDVLTGVGVFSERPKASSWKLVDPHGASASLGDRARSYLHVNCGVCHNHSGDGTVKIFFKRQLSLAETGTQRPPYVGNFGLPDPSILRLGDPYRSILLYRMNKLGYARMPHVGSRVVDPRGSTLIHDWIASLGDGGPQISQSDTKALTSVIDGKNRDTAIRTLLNTTSGALALVSALHRGDVAQPVRQHAIKLSQQTKNSDVRLLFETFLPDSERRVVLGENVRPETIFTETGVAARGKLIYYSDASRCRSCHPIAGVGEQLGPDLKDVGKKYRRGELLQHIIQPALKVDEPFAVVLVVTKAGAIHTGMIAEKSETAITLKTANKETITLKTSDILQAQPQPGRSLMPDMLLRDMTAQEAADLLAYLMTLTGK